MAEYKNTYQPPLADFESFSSYEHRYPYEQLKDPDLRYKYVRLTENLIARSLAENKDMLIFLDKSARPVAWLTRALWPTLGFKEFDSNGDPIIEPMPEIKFLNIDREQWELMMGRTEGGDGAGITLQHVPADTIDSLTGLFAERLMDEAEYVSRDEPTMLDNKNVLIVDEVSASGDTLRMSQALLARAFKNAASIDGMHWMSPDIKYDKRSGGSRTAEVPVWYSDKTPYGRLVGNRNSNRSRGSVSMRQRRGSQFLSTRFVDNDAMGIQLRKEMNMLGQEVAMGDMPVPPSFDRPDTDEFYEQYMHSVNQLSTTEFAALLRQAGAEHTPFPSIVRSYKAAKAIQ